jgi:hypothetical protein
MKFDTINRSLKGKPNLTKDLDKNGDSGYRKTLSMRLTATDRAFKVATSDFKIFVTYTKPTMWQSSSSSNATKQATF